MKPTTFFYQKYLSEEIFRLLAIFAWYRTPIFIKDPKSETIVLGK